MELQYPEEEPESVAEQVPEAEVETGAVARSMPKTNVRREGTVTPPGVREARIKLSNFTINDADLVPCSSTL